MGGLRRWARSVVDLRPGEVRTVGLMFTYGFLALTAYYVVKPVRNSIFVDRVGADLLPVVYIVTAVAVVALMVVYSRYADRVGRSVLLLSTFGVLGGTLVAFWALLSGEGSSFWASGAFYVFGKLFPLLLVSQFWLVANLLFTAAQARRLFGPIGTGLIVGGIAGSTLSGALAEAMGTTNLLLVSVAFLGGCAGTVWSLREGIEGGTESSARLTDAPARGAVGLLWDSAHLRTIAAILGLTILVGTLLDWQFNRAVELFIEGEDAKTEFFGTFFALLNVVSVGIQLLLTGWVLRRFGLGVALLVLPLTLSVASVGILALPALWTVSAAKGTEGALRYSLDQATRELLFLPVADTVKARVKPLIDLGIYRGGTGVAGLVLLVAVQGAGLEIRGVSVLIFLATGLWILAALRMRREFGASMKRLIGVRDVRLEELVLGHLNAETLEQLRRTLRRGDEEEVVYALALLRQAPDPSLAHELRSLVSHPSDRVRRQAVALLSELGVEGYAEAVEPLLHDPSFDVRTEAVRYVCEFSGEDPTERMEAFLAEDSEVRNAALGCLLRYGRGARRRRALERLRELASAEDPEERRTAAALLGQVEDLPEDLLPLLENLLRDPEVAVCHRAMEAAGRSGARSLVPLLLERLARPEYRRAARAALRGFGAGVHEALLERLADPGTPPDVRTAIPDLFLPDAEPETVKRLVDLLPELEPPARYEALRTLNKLRRGRDDLVFPAQELRALAGRELEEAATWTVLGSDLRPDAGTSASSGGARVALEQESEEGSFVLRTLAQRRSEALERAFRALGLAAGSAEDLYASFVALSTRDGRTRQRGYELLDSVLPLGLRARVRPLLDPDAEPARAVEELRRVRKMPERTPEEVLRVLVSETDDPWLALLAAREEGTKGLPPGTGIKELEARMRASSLLATTRIPSDEEKLMEIVERADVLRRTKLFQGVRAEDLAGIAALCREVSFEEGDTVFGEDEAGRGLFVVARGRIEARKGGRVLFTAEPGRSVGSLSLLDGRATDYRAVAVSPTEALTLGRTEFRRLLDERDAVRDAVIDYLTGVVRGLNEPPPECGDEGIVASDRESQRAS